MTENKNIILSAKDVVVEFDVRDRVLTAIRKVSLDLFEGEILALVGESGSGKSVLTKTFTGMLEENGRIASGTINYRGQELTEVVNNKEWQKNSWCENCNYFPRSDDEFEPTCDDWETDYRSHC